MSFSPVSSPNASAPSRHPRLLFLEVRGGYLDGVHLDFAAHTTCIIGGKGSGKTTLFELLRFAVDAPSLLAKDTARALLKKNLGAGCVRVGIETEHGVRYVFERTLAEERPRVFTPEGALVKVAPELYRIWKDTTEASPGQRSGAILPILLLGGDWPLLVDQPDDNIDPDFMCNVILPRICALKGVRQFVFVTHHANVPVLSQAGQIVLVGSDGKSASVQAHGEVGQMTPWIVSKLEGGDSAFQTRRRTYETAPGASGGDAREG